MTELNLVFNDAFHKHLDECWQCRENPFALCKEGAILLRAAGIEAKRNEAKVNDPTRI